MLDQIREAFQFAGRHLKIAGGILIDHKVKPPQNTFQSFMGSLSTLIGNVMLVLVLLLLLRTVFADVFLFSVSWFESSLAYGVIALCAFVGATALFIRGFIQGIGLAKAYYLLPLYGAWRGFKSLYDIAQKPDVQTNFLSAFKELVGLL